MNAKRKAQSGGATPERAKAEAAAMASAATSSGFHFITGGGRIATLLNASGSHLTSREIARSLGHSNPRRITNQIERERQSGTSPICASTGGDNPGYFMPTSIGELDRYIRSLQRRHKAISATLEGLLIARDTWAGQMNLFEQERKGAEK